MLPSLSVSRRKYSTCTGHERVPGYILSGTLALFCYDWLMALSAPIYYSVTLELPFTHFSTSERALLIFVRQPLKGDAAAGRDARNLHTRHSNRILRDHVWGVVSAQWRLLNIKIQPVFLSLCPHDSTHHLHNGNLNGKINLAEVNKGLNAHSLPVGGGNAHICCELVEV